MKRAVLTVVLALAAAASAHEADHVVISEVAYDTVDETGASSNYVELFNPTAAAVALDSYYLSDHVRYFAVTSGNLTISGDVVMQFPPGATISAGGFVVVCDDADAFLTEFPSFTGTLYERSQDPTSPDAIPNMVLHSTNNEFNLRNAGELAVLFQWNGTASTVKDVDIVVWLEPAEVPDKTTEVGYQPDEGSTLLAGATAANTQSLQRKNLTETAELSAGGNGLTGHDETSEDWSVWAKAAYTPGACLVQTFYRDVDADRFGDPGTTTTGCVPPPGYVVDAGDCDDGTAAIHPGVAESCDNVDQDCNGAIDDNTGPIWYRDADGDSFGDRDIPRQQCTQPTGYVTNSDDCNDSASADGPNKVELCDGRDNDCDGDIDEAVLGTFYVDADGDGYGSSGGTQACTAPAGTVSNGLDCDDSRSEVHPAPKEAVCRDQADNDCDSLIDADDPDCEGVVDPPASGCGCGSPGSSAPVLLPVLIAFFAHRRALTLLRQRLES